MLRMLFWPMRWCIFIIMLMMVIPTEQSYATPRVVDLQLGTSGAGRPVTAVKIGDGPRKFVLVGDTHGGPEANTFRLATELINYFRAHASEVPPTVRLYIIPTLNPDGLAADTRFNARGIDLNRNMNTDLDTCSQNDWSIHVQGAYGIESDTGGAFPESDMRPKNWSSGNVRNPALLPALRARLP